MRQVHITFHICFASRMCLKTACMPQDRTQACGAECSQSPVAAFAVHVLVAQISSTSA